jgi:predicted transglutaminase-like cysteine proteinase
MKKVWVLLGLTVVLLAGLATAGHAWAFPSQNFDHRNGQIFDDWDICRTDAFGADGYYQITDDGFRPVIAFESLGAEADVAYDLGQQFVDEYPDRMQRAEAVFDFVRDRVQYTSDIDAFGDEEFAQNADELASTIVDDGTGRGDCEDMTVLLAVMYKAAGFRSAIMLLTEHTSVLVYLPDYSRATAFFDLNGEAGWIWAEATGRNNPLGWAPEQYLNEKIPAYEISAEVPAYGIPAGETAPLTPPPTAEKAFSATGQGASYPPYLFLVMIGFLFFVSLLRRRRRRS